MSYFRFDRATRYAVLIGVALISMSLVYQNCGRKKFGKKLGADVTDEYEPIEFRGEMHINSKIDLALPEQAAAKRLAVNSVGASSAGASVNFAVPYINQLINLIENSFVIEITNSDPNLTITPEEFELHSILNCRGGAHSFSTSLTKTLVGNPTNPPSEQVTITFLPTCLNDAKPKLETFLVRKSDGSAHQNKPVRIMAFEAVQSDALPLAPDGLTLKLFPTQLIARFSVVIQNTGASTWVPGQFFLGTDGDKLFGTRNRWSLSGNVSPGETATFQIEEEPADGGYCFGMLREGVSRFGTQTCIDAVRSDAPLLIL